MKTNLMKWMLLMSVILMGIVSCSDETEKPTLATPQIVQHEQTDDNPIKLSFSWTEVKNATAYVYELSTNIDGVNTTIAKGETATTSVEITESKELLLSYDTKYTFSLIAKSPQLESKSVSAEVTTSPSPFKMEVTELSYRGATFNVTPTDPNMPYQTAQTEWDKYAKYESDSIFIANYEFSYYKAVPPPFVPWYVKMESACQKGNHSWKTRILSPGKTYIFYSYGCKFQYIENPKNPVALSTPFVKVKFTTPEWKATSKMTFNVTSVSQTLKDGKVVSVVKVVPSSNTEKYFVTFVEDEYVEKNYGGKDFELLMGRMGDAEKMGVVRNYNWGASKLLRSGEQTISNAETGISVDQNITAGKKYHVIVIGMSDDGLQTTEIKRLDLTAPSK